MNLNPNFTTILLSESCQKLEVKEIFEAVLLGLPGGGRKGKGRMVQQDREARRVYQEGKIEDTQHNKCLCKGIQNWNYPSALTLSTLF